MKRWDAVLIGSGISCLTAAVILAMKGRSVCVLEQHYLPGGYLHAFRKLGHSFDTGAHYVGAMDPGQPFWALLEYLGVRDDSCFTPLDPQGFDVMRFPDFTMRFAKGYPATIENLTEIFPGEARAIREYFSLVEKAALGFPTYNFSPEMDSAALAPFLENSLAKIVEGLTQNPALQSVFYSYCTLHGVEPKDVAFGFHAIVTDSLIRSPHGFSSNGNALAQAFVKRIEALGGEVHLKSRVEKIEVVDEHAKQVVLTDGRAFSAEWVIAGLHPQEMVSLLPEGALSPAFRDRVGKMRESVGLFGVYAVCAEKLDVHPLRNYYFFDTADPRELVRERGPEEKPSAIFLTQSNRLRGPGAGEFSLNMHAASPYSWFQEWAGDSFRERRPEYEEKKRAYAERIFAMAEEKGMPLQANVKNFVSSTPLTNRHYNPSPEGAAYGVYHSFDATGARALGPRTRVRNLLLTGQNTLFPGLFAAATSGLRSAGHVLGIRPILTDLQKIIRDHNGLPTRGEHS